MSYIASAIAVSGLAGAGASIFGASEQSSAAKAAAQAQVSEEQQGFQLQQQQLQTLNPWINVGQGANYTLGSLYGIGQNGQQTNSPSNFSQFFNSPDYQFAQQQGQAGLVNYQNAEGLGGSGAGLAAASTFNQGLATQQFGNYFNRLMGLSQLGASSAQAGIGGANAAAQTLGNIGASQASGITGSANAIAGGATGVASSLSGVSNNLLLQSLISNKNNASTAASNPSSYSPLPATGPLPSYPAVPFT
jgi:hypothetical protein